MVFRMILRLYVSVFSCCSSNICIDARIGNIKILKANDPIYFSLQPYSVNIQYKAHKKLSIVPLILLSYIPGILICMILYVKVIATETLIDKALGSWLVNNRKQTLDSLKILRICWTLSFPGPDHSGTGTEPK